MTFSGFQDFQFVYLRHFKLYPPLLSANSHELHKFHITFIRIKNTTKVTSSSSKKMSSDLMDTEPGGENTQ